MGALYASAMWTDGEPAPNFTRVNEANGIPKQTLYRWWDARDRSQDGTQRELATREYEADFARGAREWRSTVIELQDLARGVVRQAARHIAASERDTTNPINPRDLSDLGKGVAPFVSAIQRTGLWLGAYSMGGKDDPSPTGGRGGDDPGDVADRVRAALVRSVAPDG